MPTPMNQTGRRTVNVVALALAAAGVLVLVAETNEPSPRGDLVDSVSSDDGRYEAQIWHWQAVLGEDGWDLVLHPRDGSNVYAGCLYSESGAHYIGIESAGAGTVRLTTEEGPVAAAFAPTSFEITARLPRALCAGYE